MILRKFLLFIVACIVFNTSDGQVKWVNVDTSFGKLPKGFHVYKTTDSLDKKPFVAYYTIADLKDKKLHFSVDTSSGRRLTPSKFYEKNKKPLLVVNTTFFSFEKNISLNLVVKDGKMVAYPEQSIALKGKDTLLYKHPFSSAFGLSKDRVPDIAWVYADSTRTEPYAMQYSFLPLKDSVKYVGFNKALSATGEIRYYDSVGNALGKKSMLSPWNVETAIGGGPIIVQNGVVQISNNEEMKFGGKKGLEDKHPRTLMGYTKEGKLIIMVIQGRFPGIAEGATLKQEAELMINLGCIEAINLDGGGSSCMLVNGKETIKPSDAQGVQRAVPAVFLISVK